VTYSRNEGELSTFAIRLLVRMKRTIAVLGPVFLVVHMLTNSVGKRRERVLPQAVSGLQKLVLANLVLTVPV